MYEFGKDEKFNVIANIYVPFPSSPFSQHAQPLLCEILPNLMTSDDTCDPKKISAVPVIIIENE